VKTLYRFPPGLSRNLPFYLTRRFFRPGNPILLFEHLVATYGPVSHYRLGWNHIVFLNNPEWIREILINQPQNFIKERTQRRMKILLGEGLITSDGETHKRQRRIAAPAFHRQRIQAYGSIMVERAAQMRESWQAGREIDVSAEMMRLALQVVARTLFNADVTRDVQSINDEVNAIMNLYNLLVALPKAERLLHLPIPGLMRFRRARKRLDAVVHRIIEQHRADGVDRGDLLSMLIAARDAEGDHSGMTDEQLRDEALTIFLAGYETVANPPRQDPAPARPEPRSRGASARRDRRGPSGSPSIARRSASPALHRNGAGGVHEAVSAGLGHGPSSHSRH
jgi:cytochrome P450